MRPSRRQILKAALGGSQLALLGALGVQPRRVKAAGNDGGPSRLLTIYVPGGWMPEMFFTPLDAAGIAARVPEPTGYIGEPVFFSSADVRNLDGTGDAPDPEDPSIKRLRAPHLWDAQALASGGIDPQNGLTSPMGYAWAHEELWQHALMLHGVDVQTADHLSGRVSMMCGLAGSTFRSPALGAWVAEAFSQAYPHRPLPSVAIGGGPTPYPVRLGPTANPTRMHNVASLADVLSERSEVAWAGLRDRSSHPGFNFDSSPTLEPVDTNSIDEFVLARTRRMFGTVNSGTHGFYQEFYDTYATVSRQLALNLVDELEATVGWEHFTPTWANPRGVAPYGMKFGYANGGDSGSTWNSQFELALRLFKADMCSSVGISVPGAAGFTFDTHNGGDGPKIQSLQARVVFETVGRLLHEMKSTPVDGGKTLLDDTLVVLYSEFSRTWRGDDHWPATSVLLAGGGIMGNRQIGGFDIDVPSWSPMGLSVPLIDEGGQRINRAPWSSDLIFTALRVLGIEHFFIPGGPGEIVGVRP